MTSFYEADCPHKDCSDKGSLKCHSCRHNKRKSYYEPKDVQPYIPYYPFTWIGTGWRL